MAEDSDKDVIINLNFLYDSAKAEEATRSMQAIKTSAEETAESVSKLGQNLGAAIGGFATAAKGALSTITGFITGKELVDFERWSKDLMNTFGKERAEQIKSMALVARSDLGMSEEDFVKGVLEDEKKIRATGLSPTNEKLYMLQEMRRQLREITDERTADAAIDQLLSGNFSGLAGIVPKDTTLEKTMMDILSARDRISRDDKQAQTRYVLGSLSRIQKELPKIDRESLEHSIGRITATTENELNNLFKAALPTARKLAKALADLLEQTEKLIPAFALITGAFAIFAPGGVLKVLKGTAIVSILAGLLNFLPKKYKEEAKEAMEGFQKLFRGFKENRDALEEAPPEEEESFWSKGWRKGKDFLRGPFPLTPPQLGDQSAISINIEAKGAFNDEGYKEALKQKVTEVSENHFNKRFAEQIQQQTSQVVG